MGLGLVYRVRARVRLRVRAMARVRVRARARPRVRVRVRARARPRARPRRVHAEEPLEHGAHRLLDRWREGLAHSHLTKPVRDTVRGSVRVV